MYNNYNQTNSHHHGHTHHLMCDQYECITCNFKTTNRYNYKQHLMTKKHLKNINTGSLHHNNTKEHKSSTITKEIFVCSCGNTYKTRSGLWKHNKKCTGVGKTQGSSIEASYGNEIIKSGQDKGEVNEIISSLVKENSELRKLIVKYASEPKTVINQQNNTFNIENFLNVQCKDALNMTDFIKQLDITYEDLLYMGRNGFIKGIQQTFIKKLQQLEENKRPMHCSDKKRRILYIKDRDVWEKDADHTKTHASIEAYSNKVDKSMVDEFKKKPDEFFEDEWNQDKKREIMSAVTDYNRNTYETFNKKITGNIASACYINKTNCKTLKDDSSDQDSE